ncbi:MAG: 50S ribosomal protein L17 [Patescibacteria group bacterium]
MRHGNANRKFGRETGERSAFMRSLAIALIKNGSIKTTLPRAKEIRPYVEKLVTRAKNPTLANTRLILSRLGTNERSVTKKLVETVAPKYVGRAGGYTRITRLGTRASDAAPMAMIEFV